MIVAAAIVLALVCAWLLRDRARMARELAESLDWMQRMLRAPEAAVRLQLAKDFLTKLQRAEDLRARRRWWR